MSTSSNFEYDGDDTAQSISQRNLASSELEADAMDTLETQEMQLNDDSEDLEPSDTREEQRYDFTEGLEDVSGYQKGGFCPVHIGDNFDNGRYTIVHKLGQGGFSTVWLARDNKDERYIALRLGMADMGGGEAEIEEIHQHLKHHAQGNLGGQFISLPLHSFTIKGVNGQHPCTIFDVCGPSITQVNEHRFGAQIRLSIEERQRLSLQVSQGLAFLHSVGIAHGDFTTSNILLEAGNFEQLSVAQIYKVFGHPVKLGMAPADPNSENFVLGSTPDYIVAPIDAVKLFKFRTGNIKIIDFGSAYTIGKPPSELGIPVPFRSPELLLNNTICKQGDVWALACVIYQIRCGGDLFPSLFGGEEPDMLDSMRNTLGPLPHSILVGEWADLGFDRQPSGETENFLRDRLLGRTRTITTSYRHDPDYAERAELSEGLERLENYFWYVVSWRPWHLKTVVISATMSAVEMELLNDLLLKMLVYEFEKRPSADQILSHPWFSLNFPKPSLKVHGHRD